MNMIQTYTHKVYYHESLRLVIKKMPIQMAKKHIKRCSMILITREIQLKITMRYHLSIRKTKNNKCRWECVEKRTIVYCLWECKLVQILWETVCQLLKKLKIELPYNSAIPLLGIYPKKTKILTQKRIHTLMLTAALFMIAEIWKQPKCPSIDKCGIFHI